MTDIASAKQQLEQAQLGVIGAYLDRISQSYKSLPDTKKGQVVEGLERMVAIIEDDSPTKPKINPFDNSEAKIVRVRSKLTQLQLAKRLGISQSGISRFEAGLVMPDPYRQSKQGSNIKYLEFLKQHGYNPFGI